MGYGYECSLWRNGYHSGADNQKDHNKEYEKQDNDSANLPRVVSLQQISQLRLHKVHLVHCTIKISIEFFNEVALLRQLLVDDMALGFEALGDVVYLVQRLVLLQLLLFFESFHLKSSI